MRELVAQYLSHSISRRRFVGGLTKAGLTATAAQSVLTAVTSVSYAQGAGPQPNPAPAAPAAAPAASGPAASVVAGVKPQRGRHAIVHWTYFAALGCLITSVLLRRL